LPEEYASAKLGSIGNRPAGRFTQVRVVDESGADVGPDGVGELLLTGPSLMEGYFKDPDATAEAMSDGWLRSGDVVRLDSDGFFYHLDRKKDIIIRGGFNISSVGVEAALFEHPDVVDAAVIGVPHPRLGEDVKAFVVLRPGAQLDVAGLVEHCQARLADFEVPRQIAFRDMLPRNPSGKILKRVLRQEN
jgi:acyl-CoA synthetase (AMP-forming)/AMP-acid ligase II